MLIYKLSDLIVFSLLKNIKHGHLEVIKMNGEVLKFGDPNDGNSSSGTTSGNRIVDNILSKYLPSGQLGHRLGVL